MSYEFTPSGKFSVKYNGNTYKRWKAGRSPDDKKYWKDDKGNYGCDCGAPLGRYHNLSCDCEQCPICKGQLLSCGHMKVFMTKEQRVEAEKPKMRRIMEVGVSKG